MTKSRTSSARLHPFAILLAALVFLCLPALLAFAGVNDVPTSPRAEAAIARQTPQLEKDLAAQGLKLGNPVYFRITKDPGQLTAYVQNEDRRFEAFRSWPICAASGALGPKLKQGDRQAPEGFYSVPPSAMNPASSYHLSFNLGYPNAFDRAHDRTGDFLMVHGNCVSIGCYAMTDPVIEQVWTLMHAAFESGQSDIQTHIFPFPMTAANLQRHAGSSHDAFWRDLAPAWVQFDETQLVPSVTVVNGRYQVRGTQYALGSAPE